MVGDRSHDVEGASAHGIDTVVVEWGYGAGDFDDPEACAPVQARSDHRPTCGRCSVSEPSLHVTFVCSGNICRSPMAEKMFAHQLDERGLAGRGAGVQRGHRRLARGDAADERASHVLGGTAIRPSIAPHRSRTTTSRPTWSSRWAATTSGCCASWVHRAERIRMLRSFDPRSGAHRARCRGPLLRDDGRLRRDVRRHRGVVARTARLGRRSARRARESPADAYWLRSCPPPLLIPAEASMAGAVRRRDRVRLPVLHRVGTVAAR